MQDKFLTHERLMHAKMPILIMHGTSDMIIPHSQSQRLIDKLMSASPSTSPPVLELFDEVDHVSIVLHDRWESVLRKFWGTKSGKKSAGQHT